MSIEHLRFAPDVLRRLGEELIPHPDQGIVELVRNSYDADARTCTVELLGTDNVGGAFRIVDNGEGMNADAIQSGWLIVGRSAKTVRKPTRLGRLPVGDKGLGRLAALRMGTIAKLVTRPGDQPGVEYRLTIDWSRYDNADVVENVPLSVERAPTNDKKGTTIIVENLRTRFGRREVLRLARSLLLLADPFRTGHGFTPELVGSAFHDLEKRVRSAYFDDAELRLIGKVDGKGRATASILDRSGRKKWATGSDDLKSPYATPEADFEIWVFLLDTARFSSSSATKGEVGAWLDVVGGVHIYHRGLRVHPYGDKGHDWLDMNLARARNPEVRPSTNTSLGRVRISDPEERLVPKTDRSGFIENEAFRELQRFCGDALEWMAKRRLREAEERRKKAKTAGAERVSRAKASLADVVKRLKPKNRGEVKKAVIRLERAQDREVARMKEEIQLYQTLSTVGTTAAVFAHEASKPVTQIEQMADVIESRGSAELGDRYASTIGQPVSLVKKSAKALRSYAQLPLEILQRQKRRLGEVNVHEAIKGILELFGPFLADSGIKSELQLTDGTPFVYGSVAALESVIANLLTNCINAFNHPDAPTRERIIRLRTDISGNSMLMHVIDSGPGIRKIGLDDIWLPGYSTTPGGTGLGLTIVRDAIGNLGGTIKAIARSDLGGAEFVAGLPLLRYEE